MNRGIKTLAIALASLLTVSGCATLNEVQQRNIDKQAMRSLPTAQEYQDILDAVKKVEPTTVVGSEKPRRWLLVNEIPPLLGIGRLSPLEQSIIKVKNHSEEAPNLTVWGFLPNMCGVTDKR